MSYTKGPYKIFGPSVGVWDKAGDYAVTVPGQNGHDPYIIAEFFMTVDHGVEMPAFENANLFAASHDMLEALEDLVKELKHRGIAKDVRRDFSLMNYLVQAKKAIAKAKGGQA